MPPMARAESYGPAAEIEALIDEYVAAQAGDPRRAKLAGLRARLLGGDPRALSLIISSEERHGGLNAITDFLSASGGVKAMADRALKTR